MALLPLSIEHTDLFLSSLHSLESTVGITGFCAQYAFYLDGLILVADTCMGGSRMFVLGVDQMAVTLLSSWHTDKEATCLSLSHVSGKPFVILGTVSERGPVLEKFLLDGEQMTWKPLGAWPLGKSCYERTAMNECFSLTVSLDRMAFISRGFTRVFRS